MSKCSAKHKMLNWIKVRGPLEQTLGITALAVSQCMHYMLVSRWDLPDLYNKKTWYFKFHMNKSWWFCLFPFAHFKRHENFKVIFYNMSNKKEHFKHADQFHIFTGVQHPLPPPSPLQWSSMYFLRCLFLSNGQSMFTFLTSP